VTEAELLSADKRETYGARRNCPRTARVIRHAGMLISPAPQTGVVLISWKEFLCSTSGIPESKASIKDIS
ncbi:MAG: hypothetical protein KHX55_08480, partial [Proteobacteria bacterium]|nr:hypothetical protein [Pseudomonadota bacterium]